MILTDASDRFIPTRSLARLAPLIQEIALAPGMSAIQRSADAAVEALGYRYFAFVSGLKRQSDTPFRPLLASLPKHLCDTLRESAAYRSNPVADHIRSTGNGLAVTFATMAPGAAVDMVKTLMSPYGITGAAVVPVVSATEDLSIFAAYKVGGETDQADLVSLAMIGSAVSVRMLTLHSKKESSPLTETQLEILRWAAAGKSSGDIAVILGLSRRGCEYHLGEIYRKLGVTSRSQAVAAFARGAA